jgi:hypothetical protein
MATAQSKAATTAIALFAHFLPVRITHLAHSSYFDSATRKRLLKLLLRLFESSPRFAGRLRPITRVLLRKGVHTSYPSTVPTLAPNLAPPSVNCNLRKAEASPLSSWLRSNEPSPVVPSKISPESVCKTTPSGARSWRNDTFGNTASTTVLEPQNWPSLTISKISRHRRHRSPTVKVPRVGHPVLSWSQGKSWLAEPARQREDAAIAEMH